MLKACIALSTVLLSTNPQIAAAQQKPPASAGKSCEAFVKEFYGWYLPIAQAEIERHVDPLDLAVKANPPVLSRELIHGLEAVRAEETKTGDAGLDFDPVLNSQDPGDPGDPPYLIRDARVEGDICRADVYYQSRNGKSERIVVPELRTEHDHWIFTNFRYPNSSYPESGNLVSLIKNYLRLSTKAQ